MAAQQSHSGAALDRNDTTSHCRDSLSVFVYEYRKRRTLIIKTGSCEWHEFAGAALRSDEQMDGRLVLQPARLVSKACSNDAGD